MSEENEHTSEETESEMNMRNHNEEQSKSETSMLNNETEQPMLEDEEMPTYISISSPRREDSDVNNTKQQDRIPVEDEHSRSPCPSNDQGGGSIYVLSSGEENNHTYNDEEEDKYPDSDDMDEMDLDNEHENGMLEDEEEEDEDDDDDDDDDDDENLLRLHNDDDDDDEDIDTEYEPECFDRVSDDFVLNNRLKQHRKERSLSLQDLSISKNSVHSPYNKKRHSLNIFRQNYLAFQQKPVMYSIMHKKQMTPLKYQHVESKVKQYIRDIKEQNRRSMEKRIKEQEFLTNKNYKENETNDTEQLKIRVTSKTIKDYAEKAIKDLQREENEDGNLIYNTEQIVENGENNKNDNKLIENQYKHIQKNSEYNITQSEKHAQNSDDKLEKQNGSVDINTHQIGYQNTLDRNIKLSNMNQPSRINGHQQTPTYFDVCTLNYVDYMRSTPNSGQREELSEQKQEKTNENKLYNEAEMIIDNTSCPLKIENVKSIRMTQDESGNLNFAKINAIDRTNADDTEIIQLKSQLSQKDAQFHNLRDAYQKTLAENMKMKQELDALKKSLAKYENENKTYETKVASVQTETIEKPISNQETATTEEINTKISASSVASTVSSIDQWAESAYSPAISIKPPDLTPILNSDDSIVLTDGTPRKIAHPLSRTFITSSRILQTLSNITQGKAKMQSPLVRNSKKRVNDNSTDQLLNLDYNSPIHASSSKKRKATEMLGTSTFTQPFKIPHTTTEPERQNNTDATDVEFKYSEGHTNSKTKQEQNTSVTKNIDSSTSTEAKIDETDDREDNVKCFVYREDENSKNKSFLIQAEEPTKDRLDEEKNRIQECGPYLLGNLEVRMSEINGTISVWGKEINQEGTSDNEDGMDVSMKPSEKRTCHCWQDTLQTKFNGSPLVCSTNKKEKIPCKFNRSNVSQCRHSLSLNTIKTTSLMDELNDRCQMDNSFNSNTVPSCENCGSTRCHEEFPICKSASSSREKLHSCCVHHAEFVNKDCNCDSHHERKRYDVSPKRNKDKFYSKGIRRNSCKNSFMPNSKDHLHENIASPTAERSGSICKYHKTYRHSLQDMVDNNSHSKCCSIARDVSCTCKSSLDDINNHDGSERYARSRSLSNDGEEDPLILPKRSNETPETRQRRLSGKRVRGILMDLLRGCGDCRSNNASRLSKSEQQQKESPYIVNDPPQIKITAPPTPEPTCSNSTQCNDRCCHAYARRIESQLEEFRMEMERVRSRSDAILDMLTMLHSVDMN